MHGRKLDRLFERFRRAGDVRALSRVFDLTSRELLELAAYLAHDPAEAEDLVQATFLTAIEHAERYDASRSLMPWLVGILTREARSWNRRGARSIRADGLAERRVDDPATAVEERELSQAVRAAIEKLPELYREVLVAYLRDGKPSAEIARTLGRAPGTVRVQIHRGIELLRKSLPVGVAGAVGLGLATRGLAAVRSEVLRHAATAPIAALSIPVAATALAGGIAMKKLVVVAASVLVALATWKVWPEGRPVTKTSTVAAPAEEPIELLHPQVPTTSAADEALPPEPRSAVVTKSQSELEPSPTAGTLDVFLAWHDGSPASEVGVYVTPDDASGSGRGWRPERERLEQALTCATDAQGHCRFLEIPAGTWGVSLDRTQNGAGVEVLAGQTSKVEIAVERGVDVEGVVVDERGEPVGGASIWLCSAWNFEGCEAARTASDGSFRLRSLEDQCTVGARAKGFAPSGMRWMSDPTLGAGASLRLRLVLEQRGGSIAGTVRDPRGAPVANARVSAGEPRQFWSEGDLMMTTEPMPDGGSRFAAAPVCARTDAAGRFLLQDIALGEVPLGVEAQGWAPWRGVAQVEDDVTARADVELQRAATIRGSVRRQDGSTAGEIFVLAILEPWWHGQTSTDSAGAFRLESIPPGQVKLYANPYVHGADGRAESVLILEAGEEVVWDATLPLANVIRGRAIDERDEPLADWTVRARAANESIARRGTATDAEGRFELFGCDAESYDVHLLAPGADWSAMPSAWASEVRPGEEELLLRVSSATLSSARIVGRLVAPDGEPAGEAKMLASFEALLFWADAVCDPSTGRFEFDALSPGGYTLSARYAEVPQQSFGKFEVRAGQALDVGVLTLLAGGTVRAVVRDEDGAIPSELVAELLVDTHGMTRFALEAEPDGSLRSKPLLGEYILLVRARGCVSERVPVKMIAGQEKEVEVRLRRGRHCTLRMLLPDGFGAQSGIWLRLSDTHGTLLVDELLLDLPAGTEASYPLFLGSGSYSLVAQLGMSTLTRAEFQVSADSADPTTIDLRLRVE